MPEAKELGPLERAVRRMLGMPLPEPDPDQGDQNKNPKLTDEDVK